MPDVKITINRAPVLTLWAAVVAERLGFEWDEALTLGKVVAGLNAQSKGRALGIFTRSAARAAAAQAPETEEVRVELLRREVRCADTDEGLRALDKGKPVDPAKVEAYLEKRFGDALGTAREAMAAVGLVPVGWCGAPAGRAGLHHCLPEHPGCTSSAQHHGP